jgi:predicted pyridoxine 5'-phosphate oxidase superfamily flavin-nucleotide-binding protein
MPKTGLVVTVEEAFFHCGKALIRSRLWDPEAQVERGAFVSLGRILAEQAGGIDVEEAEKLVAENYRTEL